MCVYVCESAKLRGDSEKKTGDRKGLKILEIGRQRKGVREEKEKERVEREGERRENGMGRTARQWVSSKVLAVILTKMKKEATKNSTYSILSVPTVYSYISFH